VDLCIENLRTAAGTGALAIAGMEVSDLGAVRRRHRLHIDGAGCWLVPGLINAHDHLGLDLLPPLGEPPYPNSAAWGEAVFRPERSPLREVLRLHYGERLWWGAYRNLLAGVTTVQHHDRGHWCLRYLPVRVPPYRWQHRPDSHLGGSYGRGGRLFVHAAEGTDAQSHAEIRRLDELGLLGPASTVIHAIALDKADIARLAATGTGVVLCPTSNRFLYGRTAPVRALKAAGVPLAIGTDSTASGSLDLLAELRSARDWFEEAELLDLVTAAAARLLGVPQLGRLVVGAPADLVLIENPRARTVAEAVLSARPEQIRLVLVGGEARLVRAPFERLLERLRGRLQPVGVDGETTWLAGPIRRLLGRARALLGERLYFGRRFEV
jgi:cytosine/adenosine deaminase-related metal-dependent hydrolase